MNATIAQPSARVSRTLRRLMRALVLLSLLACFCCARAQAQGIPGGGFLGPFWALSASASGNFAATLTDASGKVTYQGGPWQNGGSNNFGYDQTFGGGQTCVSCVAAFSATVTVTAKWINLNGTPGANPPPVFNLDMTNSCTSDYVTTAGSAQSDDGLGDPAEGSAYTRMYTSAGTHWKPVPATSGVATFVCKIGGSFTSTGLQAGGAFGGDIAFVQDGRVVFLSRDGAHNETVDPNGTIHGDTLYSLHAQSQTTAFGVPVNNDWVNWQTFRASVVGPWSKQMTWVWSPNESQDTEEVGLWSQPFGQLSVSYPFIGDPIYSGKDSPVTNTLT